MQKLLNYPFKEVLRIESASPSVNLASASPLRLFSEVSPQDERKGNSLQGINNHLKSPQEIEAEFVLFKHQEQKNSHPASDNSRSAEELMIIQVDQTLLVLPEYMEENY